MNDTAPLEFLRGYIDAQRDKRTTPEHIGFLKPGEIFVFGSNTKGRHGKGAAVAALEWGAKWGEPFGLHGRTFAIPTLLYPGFTQLPMAYIKACVDQFTGYAKGSEKNTFLVTEIGCGLARFKPEQIAPLFESCVKLENVKLPARFWDVLAQRS